MVKDSESSPAIEVQQISKRFGAVTALDSVSFSVAPGELFFILGPSGCGKTTMLRILAGLEIPDSGTLRFAGRDVAGLPPHLRGAPMVFQNYALWPHLSVKDNIAFGLVERKISRPEIEKRVGEILERLELQGLGARMPGQLSGGQQQRVVLGRALVLNPGVLLLDEPLSNLDAKLRAEMRDEIEKLHRQIRISFVYVTHDQTEALSLADRLIVMDHGKICAMGSPHELYNRPPNLFCANFLGESNSLPGTILSASPPFAEVKTGFGTWKAVFPSGTQPSPGQAAHCLFRPENLRPATPGQPEGNGLQATVASSRFNGATFSVILQAGEIRLKALLVNEQTGGAALQNQNSWTVAPEQTIVIPDQKG